MIIYVLGDRDFLGGTGFLPPVYGGPGVIRIRGARCNLRPGGQGFLGGTGFLPPLCWGTSICLSPLGGAFFATNFPTLSVENYFFNHFIMVFYFSSLKF